MNNRSSFSPFYHFVPSLPNDAHPVLYFFFLFLLIINNWKCNFSFKKIKIWMIQTLYKKTMKFSQIWNILVVLNALNVSLVSKGYTIWNLVCSRRCYICLPITYITIISDEEELKLHGLIHTTQFICFVCNKSFNRKNNLKSHIRIHSLLEKKHACTECDKKFTLSKQLTVCVFSFL